MASSARAQRKASATGVARAPDLNRFYRRELPAITPGDVQFRLDLIRGRGLRNIPLNGYVERFEWVDEDEMMTGALQVRRPDPSDRLSLPIGDGHRVRCRIRWGGAWYTLWTMRVGDIDPGELPSAAVNVPLRDDMDLVRRGSRRWVYRRTRRRKAGRYGHDILRDAARREGIELGTIAKCSTRMPKIDERGSFLMLAKKIYEREQEKTGRSFVLRMRDGKFEAVHYKRNQTIFVIEGTARSIKVTRKREAEEPVTAITGTARLKNGGDKIRHHESNREVVRRLGYIHEQKDYGRVESMAELRGKVRRELAKNLRTKTEVTVQTAGLPLLRRGDGARVIYRPEGLTGKASYVYATAVRHQVQSGTFTTDADFTQDDPFLLAQREREKEIRARKRAKRGRSS